jgi:hypothetical protein
LIGFSVNRLVWNVRAKGVVLAEADRRERDELLGVAAVVLSLAFGLLNAPFAVLFLFVAVGYGTLLSLAALAIEEFSYHRYHRWRDLAAASAASLFENVGYRQLHAFWRLRGIIDAVRRRDTAWGAMTRVGFGGAEPG